MKHEKTKALYEYWNSVRGNRQAPRRLEIEPGAIASLLPNVFILQRMEQAIYRFRLAGTHTCAYFATELRDKAFTSLWPHGEREAVDSLLRSIGEEGAGVVAGLEGRERSGRVAPFELLLLPLATKPDRYDRVLGSMCAIDSPYWLGNWPLISVRLTTVRILWPGRRPSVIEHFTPSTDAEIGGHQLTVIDGGLSGVGRK